MSGSKKRDYAINLRSDTVTLPSEEMLEAIRNAELGDTSLERTRRLMGLRRWLPRRW